jgi:hypothetical protein
MKSTEPHGRRFILLAPPLRHPIKHLRNALRHAAPPSNTRGGRALSGHRHLDFDDLDLRLLLLAKSQRAEVAAHAPAAERVGFGVLTASDFGLELNCGVNNVMAPPCWRHQDVL